MILVIQVAKVIDHRYMYKKKITRYLNISGKCEHIYILDVSNLRQIIGTSSATVSDPKSDKYKTEVLYCSVPIFMR